MQKARPYTLTKPFEMTIDHPYVRCFKTAWIIIVSMSEENNTRGLLYNKQHYSSKLQFWNLPVLRPLRDKLVRPITWPFWTFANYPPPCHCDPPDKTDVPPPPTDFAAHVLLVGCVFSVRLERSECSRIALIEVTPTEVLPFSVVP